MPNDHVLVSFDIKSHFTNVPLGETNEIILNRIFKKSRFQLK